MARETVQLLTCETPDFIAPALWPANSPDLNPVDYQIWGKLQGTCVSQPDSWRWPAEVTPDRTVGTFPPGVHRWSDQVVASMSSSLHSSTRGTFWTQTLVMFTFIFVQTYTLTVIIYVCGCSQWTLLLWDDLIKPVITIASVDRFYLNLVICLPIDITFLVQKSVKMWHCLSELWQCIQGLLCLGHSGTGTGTGVRLFNDAI